MSDLANVLAELRTQRRMLLALLATQGVEMSELENLQAADAAIVGAVSNLATEQATFLADIAARLAASGADPAAVQAVADDIQAQVSKLNDLAAAEVAADPGPPPAPAV